MITAPLQGENMGTLKYGQSGADVEKLQQRLKYLGYYTTVVDGEFGTVTKQSVINFQRDKGLREDGIVGRMTMAELAVLVSVPVEEHDKQIIDPATKISVAIAATMCQGTPRDNIANNLPLICAALAKKNLSYRAMLLMAIATVYVETGKFKPIDEGISRFNTTASGPAFDKYDDRHDLGNQGRPDGESYKGRGYIQLTGRANYRDIGHRITVDLEDNPYLANDPEIAAAILAEFLKRSEAKIRSALLDGDLKLARRLVNGGSHGLAEFKACFKRGEQLL